ncbi:MAG: DUF92 domain-containing protein [Bacteroidota bacterium]
MLTDLLKLLPLGGLIVITTLLTEWAVRSKKLPYWLSRKILHIIAVGSCAIAPRLVEDLRGLIVLVMLSLPLLYYLITRRKLMLDENKRPAWGIVWFPVAYLFLLTHAFFTETDSVTGPMLVLALCDPAATITGKLFGSNPYRLTGEPKTLAGNIGFFLSFLVLTYVVLWLDPIVNGTDVLFRITIIGLILTATEALGSYGLDNLFLPLVCLLLGFYSPPQVPLEAVGLTLILAVPFYLFFVRRRSLSPGGAVAAILLGVLVVWFVDWIALLPLVFFFASSILIGKLLPHQTVSDTKDKQPRDAVQVACNGLAYFLILAGGAIASYGYYREGLEANFQNFIEASRAQAASIFSVQLLTAALISIAVSTADTWASEVGQYFKQATYDLVRWRKVPPGLSGGVSLVGSMAALIGAACVGGFAWSFRIPDLFGSTFVSITTFGFLGMLLDSVLGGLLQRQYYDGQRWRDTPGPLILSTRGLSWMTNDLVNLVANLVTVGLYLIWVN